MIPKLSKVLNDNCIVCFYRELDPNLYINVKQGKVIIKNVGKYLRINTDERSNGSISKWRRKDKTKIISNQLKRNVKNFFLR